MSDIFKFQDQNFKTSIINPFSVLDDLKDNMDTILRKMEDIKYNEITLEIKNKVS